jgi:hypothetical protein
MSTQDDSHSSPNPVADWFEAHPEDAARYAGKCVALDPRYGVACAADSFGELMSAMGDNGISVDSVILAVSHHYGSSLAPVSVLSFKNTPVEQISTSARGGDVIFRAGSGWDGHKANNGILGGSIRFLLADGSEMLRFDPEGAATVRGESVDSNTKVYASFLEWLEHACIKGPDTTFP